MGLISDRNTISREAGLLAIPVAAGVRIYAGSMVAVKDGYARPAGPGMTGAVVAGMAEVRIDNSGGADGDVWVRVRIDRIFGWRNSATAPVAPSGLFKPAFAEDDETVAGADAGGLPYAGIVVKVDDGGVWVQPIRQR